MFVWFAEGSFIHDWQDEYYQIINWSNTETEFTAFIELMISVIEEVLLEVIRTGDMENMSTEEQRWY